MNHMGRRMRGIVAEHDRGPQYAVVTCIGDDFTCEATARVKNSAQLTDDQIVELLAERGWSVGPTLCP